MTTNVLKKIIVGNPLINFGIRKEVELYDNAKTDEEIANCYHLLLDRYGHRPLVRKWIYLMIDYSTGAKKPLNIKDLFKKEKHQYRITALFLNISFLVFGNRDFIQEHVQKLCQHYNKDVSDFKIERL